MSAADLRQKHKALQKDLFNLNYQKKMGTVEKPAQFRTLKRDIARTLTVLREKEIENKKPTV